jgi:hypothetical protein
MNILGDSKRLSLSHHQARWVDYVVFDLKQKRYKCVGEQYIPNMPLSALNSRMMTVFL